MNTRRRASFLACAVVAVSAACGTEGDARDAGVADVPRPTDAGHPDAGHPDAGPLRAVSLAASSAGHVCAAMSDGTVRCWGLNDYGQVGAAPSGGGRCTVRGDSIPCESRPHTVAGLSDVRQVATGNGSTCALRGDGSVWCWGLNDGGQLGNGSSAVAPSPTPARVDLPAARQVAMGAFHACALLTDGTVRCWGLNRFGQVGLAVASSPRQCDPGTGDTVGCVPTPTAVAGLSGVSQISLGRHHSCARLADGTLRCWGLNDSAQLGLGRLDPDTAPQVSPASVAGTGVAEVASGGSHTCYRGTDGTVHCWGWGDLGQLGGATLATCTTVSRPVQCAQSPGAVPGLTGVSAIAAGRYHTCAVLSGGGMRCFGRDDSGQLGGGSPSGTRCTSFPDDFPCSRTPREVSISGAASASVGDYHSCALSRDGEVRCWGYNAFGQLGDGGHDDRPSPALVRLVP